MFGFFKKKKTDAGSIDFDYNEISVDLHSHVLPGIDDGAQTVEESVELIRRMIDLGIKKIIATPHVMVDYYRNNPDTIIAALNKLQEKLDEEGISIEIGAAAEHYFDESFSQRIDDDMLLTMGTYYVLFEVSFVSRPLNLFDIVTKMTGKGYKPILAHPERYPYFTLEDFEQIKSWGCALQLNTISLTGYYGKQAREMAEALVDNNMIDFISSDMHHTRHAEALQNALREPYLKKLMQSGLLKNKELL